MEFKGVKIIKVCFRDGEWKFWITLGDIVLILHIQIPYTLSHTSQQVLPLNICNTAVWMASSVGPDQSMTAPSSDLCLHSLRKHAYSNILKILPPKKLKFSDKNSDIFHISAQKQRLWYSLEPPHRGGSNKYPQSMFLSRNKKNNVYSCKPQFYCIKVGFMWANFR